MSAISPGRAIVVQVTAGVVTAVLAALLIDYLHQRRERAAGAPLSPGVAPGYGSA